MSNTNNMVDHPNHYQSTSGLEAIDVIQAMTEDLSGIEAFDTGNALKYLMRWHRKNGVQDLQKAIWYIQHLIKHEEAEIAKFNEERLKSQGAN